MGCHQAFPRQQCGHQDQMTHEISGRQIEPDGARFDGLPQLEDVVQGHGADVGLRPAVTAELDRLLKLDPSRKTFHGIAINHGAP